ncbi:MAG: hypothetical protein V3T99_00880 [Nitrososphaerales archaeon]
MVDAFLELQEIILDKGSSRRALAVASRDIHLENELALNTIYLIELQEGQNAAGGRFGGFGQRGVSRIISFTNISGAWRKEVEMTGSEQLKDFEPPYHAAAMPLTLPDGKEVMVAGVIDETLVEDYNRRFRDKGS